MHQRVLGDRVWCPVCNEYTNFLRVRTAAAVADVDRRTIYRYVEEGLVHSVKIAGKTCRVCSGCLLRDENS